MIDLKKWMEIVNYRITEGSDYFWGRERTKAYSLDSWNSDQDGHSFTIIFDTNTQEVFEVQAHDYSRNRAYRLINPAYSHSSEEEGHQDSDKIAWDEVEYVDLEEDDDWIEKAIAIQAGKDYDTRVQLSLNFTDEEALKYMRLAHEQDMTFNDWVNKVLSEQLNSPRYCSS